MADRLRAMVTPPRTLTWQYLIVTAPDPARASSYVAQLRDRRERGLLSWADAVQVLPDPPGDPLGSGGATLWAVSWVAREMQRKAAQGARHLPD